MNAPFIRFIIIVLLLGSPIVTTSQGISRPNSPIDSTHSRVNLNRRPSIRPVPGLGAKLAAAPAQAAGPDKPQPLTKQQLLDLISGGVPSQRAMELVRDRGINFEADDDFIRSLRRAGATDVLIGALRRKNLPVEGITVETAPNAQVFLDEVSQGQADAGGVLVIRAKVGTHTLRVSQAGKKDFKQKLDLVDGQPIHVVAPLAGASGAVRVKAPVGATIFLDHAPNGIVDASGEILLSGVSAGAHTLMVRAKGKVDNARDIVMSAGTEMPVEVALADAVQVNPQDGLQYIWIRPGMFLMGCSPGDSDCSEPEKPAHSVRLSKAYWIGQTEATVGSYRRFASATKIKMPSAAPKRYQGWNNRNFPMIDVTWDEANRYCTWIGGRLPTEAEWEYAARGGTPDARYGSLGNIAWTKDNAESQTHPVAGKQENGFGLFDSLGNVWEWVNDWFVADYYKGGPAQDPAGPSAGQQKVLRGGAWIVEPKLVRVSTRYSIAPDARSDFFGFRCVWEPKTP